MSIASPQPRLLPRWATRAPIATRTVLGESADGRIRTEAFDFPTATTNEFFDLTDDVVEVLARTPVSGGQVTVFSPHTTTSVVINEAETGFLNDYRRLADRLVPQGAYYEHDDHRLRTENLQDDEPINGYAHCRSLLIGQTSVTVPVVDGALLLGRWQRIMFCELDGQRRRRVVIHVQGA